MWFRRIDLKSISLILNSVFCMLWSSAVDLFCESWCIFQVTFLFHFLGSICANVQEHERACSDYKCCMRIITEIGCQPQGQVVMDVFLSLRAKQVSGTLLAAEPAMASMSSRRARTNLWVFQCRNQRSPNRLSKRGKPEMRILSQCMKEQRMRFKLNKPGQTPGQKLNTEQK